MTTSFDLYNLVGGGGLMSLSYYWWTLSLELIHQVEGQHLWKDQEDQQDQEGQSKQTRQTDRSGCD